MKKRIVYKVEECYNDTINENIVWGDDGDGR